ncbi:MAG: NAD(+) synthase [Prevotellaceae bacterium]|jgi:NAD+ synthase (glutamine-hydrolysing)|nr:NAD(+) synthase [Prevotellaceae bacterium]
MFHNFVKVAAAIPIVEVADCQTNAERIFDLIQEAENQGVEIVCFPELCITGYTCGDLFYQTELQKNALKALIWLVEKTADFHITFIVGLPIYFKNALFNVAVVCRNGKVRGFVPKINMPNNNEFYEKRWFSSGQNIVNQDIILPNEFDAAPFGVNLMFEYNEFKFGIEICEDLWTPIPPSSQLAMHEADFIFNLSASNELTAKHLYRKQLVAQQSARCISGYVYVSAGFGESSTDLLFASSAFIAENGVILAESERFVLDKQLIISEIDIDRLRADRAKNSNFNNSCNSTEYQIVGIYNEDNDWQNFTRKIDRFPFVPQGKDLDERCEEIFNIQANALAVRLFHTKIDKVTIGVSGGLDSTLALLVTAAAFDKLKIDRKNIFGITMPGFGTTARTKNNAWALMRSLGISAEEISIEKAVLQHFADIGQSADNHNVTYENSQARERTQILMDYANKIGGLVVGTGDMSELALGWATFNGDHISMYGVNLGVPKTLVRHLVKWVATQFTIYDLRFTNEATANILLDIAETPISPELLPADENGEIAQKTEDVVGPYELHDFFLYYFLRFGFSPEKILFLAEQAFCLQSQDEKIYTSEEIKKWLKVFLKRFFANQFKRSCMPDGVKVGSVNLSPRGDWRMPSDASAREWLMD